jgi:hypothetical protein
MPRQILTQRPFARTPESMQVILKISKRDGGSKKLKMDKPFELSGRHVLYAIA